MNVIDGSAERRMGQALLGLTLVLASIPGSVGRPDLASSGSFSTWLHPAASTIEQTSPASPSLPGEKTARSRADDGVFRQSLRAGVHVFRGTSDASAAVAIHENLFVVADDENNVLRKYQISGSDRPVSFFDMTDSLGVDSEHPEVDIEGAARVGDRIYWISSHGRNKDGKFRNSRYRFFATAIRRYGQQVSLIPEGEVCKTMARDLIAAKGLGPLGLDRASARDVSLPKKKRQRLAPKREGLNIEGLCASVDGRTLFIGLRNPRPQRRAVVIPLTNPAAVIEEGTKPKFARPLFWDLKNLGIRAMENSSFHRAYFIVAGPHDTKGGFVLYRWSGHRADPPQRVQTIDAAVPNFTPEALVAFVGRAGLWVLSDDGSVLVSVSGPQDCLPGELLSSGTCQNKHLLDPLRKTFRGAWLTVMEE